MSAQRTSRHLTLLFLAALLLAFASTIAIRAYYQAAGVGLASGLLPPFVWFVGSFTLAISVGLVVLRVVQAFHLSASGAAVWAIVAMTVAVLAMIGIECASTWADRAVPRFVVAAHRLTNAELVERFSGARFARILLNSLAS